jgi:hypothetical protein
VEGCNFRTLYEFALKSHKNSKHERSLLYQCELCQFTSTNRGSMIRHEKIHLGIRDFVCMFCNYSAVTKHEIVRHMGSHSKQKIFFCDRCDFSTMYSHGLRVHLMQHLNVKPYQCSVCELTAVTRQRIVQHQQAKHPTATSPYIINLGIKLDIDYNQFKRKTSECYVVKNEDAVPTVEVEDKVSEILEVVSADSEALQEQT